MRGPAQRRVGLYRQNQPGGESVQDAPPESGLELGPPVQDQVLPWSGRQREQPGGKEPP